MARLSPRVLLASSAAIAALFLIRFSTLQTEESNDVASIRRNLVVDISFHRNLERLREFVRTTEQQQQQQADELDQAENLDVDPRFTCPKANECRFLLIPGIKLHRYRLGSALCEQGCLMAPSRLYLKRGWTCGACPRGDPQPLPLPTPPKPASPPVSMPMASAPMARVAPVAPAPVFVAPVPTKATAPAPVPTVPAPIPTVPVAVPTVPTLPVGVDARISAAVVAYINSIVSTGVTLSLTGTTPEDMALQWLALYPVPLHNQNHTMSIALPFTAATKVRLAQRFALLCLYFQQNGPPATNNLNLKWLNASGWLSQSTSECTWYGLSCTVLPVLVVASESNVTVQVPVVTAVRMDNNNLVGSLSSELGHLSHVQHVSLNHNRLVGSLPSAALNKWTSLQSLRLANNSLYGTLSPLYGAAWSKNLTYVQLNNNKLSGSVPSEIGYWTKLTYFAMNHNRLTGTIPDAIVAWNQTIIKATWNNNRFTVGLVPEDICDRATVIAAENNTTENDMTTENLPQVFASCRNTYACSCCVCV